MNTLNDQSKSAEGPKRSFWWRWTRRFLIAALVLVLLLVGVYLLRGPLLAEPLGRLTGDQLSDALGGRFRVARIEGNWYETLEIVGLETIEAPTEGPIVRLGAPRIAVRFRLSDIFGERPAEALRELVARDLEVELDLTRPSPAKESAEEPSAPLDIPALLDQIPQRGAALDISGSLSVKASEQASSSGRFSLSDGPSGGYLLTLTEVSLPPSLDLRVPNPLEIGFARDAEGRYVLSCREEPFSLKSRVSIVRGAKTATTDIHTETDLTTLGAQLDLSFHLMELERGVDLVQLDLKFDADLGDAKLHRFLERFLPSDSPRLARGRAHTEVRGGGSIAANELRSLNLSTKVMNLGLAPPPVSNEGLAFGAIRDLNLEAQATLESPRTATAQLDLSGLGATARLRGLGLDFRGETPALAGLEDLRVELRDLGARARALMPELAAQPWPADTIDADLALSVPEGDPRRAPLVVEAAEIRCGSARAGITGQVQLPESFEDFSPTTVDLKTAGAVPALEALLQSIELPAKIRGAVDWTGTIKGRVDEPTARFDAELRRARLDDYDLGAGDLSLGFADGIVDLSRLVLKGGLAAIDGAGRLNLETSAIENGHFALSVPDLSPLRDLAPDAPAIDAALTLNADLQKTAGPWTGGWSATASGRAADLKAQGEPLGQADFTFRMDDTRAELQSLRLEGPAGRIAASGTVDLALDPPAVDLKTLSGASLDLARLMRLAPPAADGTAPPAVAGTLSFSGRATKPGGIPWDRLGFTGEVKLLGLGVDAQTIGDVDLAVTAADRIFGLERLSVRGPWGDVLMAARATLEPSGAGRATLSALQGTIQGYPLLQNTPAIFAWQESGSLVAENLDLELLGGRLQGRLARDGVIDAEFKGLGFDLSKLPVLKSKGIVDLDLTANGELADPRFDLRLHARDLEHDGLGSISAEFALSQTADALRLEDLKVTGPGLVVSGQGTLPARIGAEGAQLLDWSDGDLGLKVKVDGPDAPGEGQAPSLFRQLAERLALPAEYGFDRLGLNLGLRQGSLGADFSLEAPRAGDDFASVIPTRIDLNLAATAEATNLKLAAPPAGGFRFSGEGRVDAGIGTRLAQNPAAAFRTAPVTFDLDVHADDLAPFAAATPDLVRLAGRLDATLGIRGRVDAPEPRARIELADLAARTDSDLPSLTRGRVQMALDNRRLTLTDVRAELGHAPVHVEGTLNFEESWESPVFDLNVDGQNTLLARNEDLRLRADLDLQVDGPLERLELSGQVKVTDALFTKPITLEGSSQPTADDRFQIFSLRRPPLSNLQFDLDIVADRTIRIDNNLASGLAAANLHLIGDGAVPKPEGRVDFAGLRVILPFSKLRLERGAVIFDAGDPFSPRLAINGNTRMRGYDLTVDVSGRLPDQRVAVRADPFLAQEDALLLLSVGATRQGLRDEGLGRAALTRAGSMIGDSLIGELFGPGDPEEEGLADRFSVEIGRDVSRSGASTLEVEYRAMKRLFLRAERDRYDDYNLDLVWRLRFR